MSTEHYRIWRQYQYRDMYPTIDDRLRGYRKYYQEYWRDRSQWYWLGRLWQEVWELTLSMLGVHKDPVDLELAQINGICANWLEMRDD